MKILKLSFLFALVLSLALTVTPVCAQSTSAASAVTTQATFDTAYWLHQPTPVQALQNMPEGIARQQAAAQLATQGYLIDQEIMSYGWDPYLVMQLRQNFGYTWVPSLLAAPVQMAPGLAPLPGYAAYDPANPEPGAIKVSLNLSDYPPFNPPPVVAPPVPTVAAKTCVGVDEGAGYFQAFPGCGLKEGQVYTGDPRGTFVFHQSSSPFAPNNVVIWFTQQ